MQSYEKIRGQYRPKSIKILLVAESPPPQAEIPSSRHFYRTDEVRTDDRLFVNTIKALYPDALSKKEIGLEKEKQQWLRKFKADGFYMIEALEKSLPHEISKPERQALIAKNLPTLLERIRRLANKDTKIILIKSNVFEIAAKPLQQAGFMILNKELVDYPGHFNQRAYREKLAHLTQKDQYNS